MWAMWVFGAIIGFVVGLVACFVVMVSFGTVPRSGREDDEHEHDWEVRGAHQLYRVRTAYGIQLQPTSEGAPITEVLFRCTLCEEVTTDTLEGHWTYAQLSGDPMRFAHSNSNTLEAESQDGNQIGTDGNPAAGGVNSDGTTGDIGN